MQTSPKRVRLLIASWRHGKGRRSFAGCFSPTTPDSCLDRSGRGQRMVDSISAFFSHVLTGGAVTCRKPSPQLSIGLLLSRGFPAFGQRVMWKTIPRPGRWKRLGSAARALYPSFQFIPTSPQILVIATPMPSPAVSKWEGVVYYQFSGGGQQAVQLCPISCRIGCFARYSLRRA